MRIKDIDRRYAEGAAKWVWVSGPKYVFEIDGAPRQALLPVEEVLSEHYEDDNGWWTCHPKTKAGDHAVVYRSGAANDAGQLPRRGPKDFCQVVLATSDAFPLADDPLAGEFSIKHGCRFVPVAEFSPPVEIGELKADPALAAWPALRAGFVRSAYQLPDGCGADSSRSTPVASRKVLADANAPPLNDATSSISLKSGSPITSMPWSRSSAARLSCSAGHSGRWARTTAAPSICCSVGVIDAATRSS